MTTTNAANVYPLPYQQLWDTMEIINPDEIEKIAQPIMAIKQRYTAVSTNTGVPWWVIAALHYREADCNFKCHLYNGDPLTARTVHVPKGQPTTGKPPFTWEESAIGAIKYDKLDQDDWHDLPSVLYHLELYNGSGYIVYHKNVLSPYLWSGTNHYTKGKYRSDGIFDASEIDAQIGCAPLMFFLLMGDENDL